MIVRRGEDDYEPTPTGLLSAVCANIFDLGLQSGYEGKIQQKLAMIFELDARRSDGKRFTVTKEFTASLHEKAALLAFLVAWRGVAFTDAELDGFDMDKLIGAPCCLNLIQQRGKNGKDYVEIASIMRIQRGTQAMKPETPRDFIPAWVKRKIDYQLVPGHNGVPLQQGQRQAAAAPQTGRNLPTPADNFEDDIPF